MLPGACVHTKKFFASSCLSNVHEHFLATALTVCYSYHLLQWVQNLDGSNLHAVATGLVQNYGLCVDTYAQHLYYIQGGNGGSITCFAYGKTQCNTPT